MSNQADFPIGFAESSQANDQDNTTFYVEWLENNAEFPDLTKTKSTVPEGNWEVLEQEEVDKEELTVVSEKDNWSKINDFHTHSYVEIAEKNADDLKPTKRVVQPLYPDQEKTKDNSTKEKHNDDDDDDIDTDTIYDAHKSQAKIAIRSTHLRRIHDLKTLEPAIPGIYEMGTAKTKDPVVMGDPEKGADTHGYKSKADALRDVATLRFTKYKWYLQEDSLSEKRNKVDDREYNVLDSNRKRDHNIIE